MTESSTTAPPLSFNLWREPWIRVTCADGREIELSIGACLAEAHTLYGLHDPSPLVVAGVHRLLTAIVQAIYAPESLDEIEEVLRAGRFDPVRLEAFAAQHNDRFDLFHPTTPFLQTGDVPLDGWRKPEKGDPSNKSAEWVEPLTVAKLFVEVPSASNRTLFHHVTDEIHQTCPACCARVLVTIPAFARAEGGGSEGYKPSINGLPPIYVLPAGENLFQSLALSLTASDFRPKAADTSRDHVNAWVREPTIPRKQEVSSVGYLESLTFPSRRIRLYPHSEIVSCSQCDEHTSTVVRQIYFKMGLSRSKASGVWDDPFVARQQPKGKRSDKSEPQPVRPQEGKALWREYGGLLLTSQDNQELRPKIVRQIGRLIDRGVFGEEQLVRFRCIGMRTSSDAKIFEWLDEALEAPPRLLVDLDGARLVEDALQRAGEAERVLNFVFNLHFRPERAQHERIDQRVVRFKTLRGRMQATFWERLAPEFRELIVAAANPAQRPAVEQGWADTLLRVGNRTFTETADQIGDRADALRARVEAQAVCRRQLNAKRKEWFRDQ